MSEPSQNIDLIAKRAALGALETSIELHIRRAEELNIEYQALAAEVAALEEAEVKHAAT